MSLGKHTSKGVEKWGRVTLENKLLIHWIGTLNANENELQFDL